jgi:hypothetical protein
MFPRRRVCPDGRPGVVLSVGFFRSAAALGYSREVPRKSPQHCIVAPPGANAPIRAVSLNWTLGRGEGQEEGEITYSNAIRDNWTCISSTYSVSPNGNRLIKI